MNVELPLSCVSKDNLFSNPRKICCYVLVLGVEYALSEAKGWGSVPSMASGLLQNEERTHIPAPILVPAIPCLLTKVQLRLRNSFSNLKCSHDEL